MNTDLVLETLEKYQSLHLSESIDFDKFNQFAITHHSTAIEGSTLTEIETRLLLEEDLTPKGKPLGHSLMVKDHFAALQFVLKSAVEKREITTDFIQKINGAVLKNTGATYRTVFGDIDSTKGEFRKNNVFAGTRYFVNYQKVEKLTTELAEKLQNQLKTTENTLNQLRLSFDAHYELVTIHPFYDGNGRTSRLLMNFIQQYFDLPISNVFSEDKVAYFESLEAVRDKEDLFFFRNFMFSQYQKQLQREIDKFIRIT